MAGTPARPTVIPSVMYRDPMAALKWLEQAFGFELASLLVDSQGNLAHSEMRVGNSEISVGSEWADWIKSPASNGGTNSQLLRIILDKDLDAHCERARKAGARIEREPEDQFYGARTYMAVDPEGHRWSFNQTVRDVSLEDMEKASGLKWAKAPEEG